MSSQGPTNGTASDYGSGNPGGSFAAGSKAWTNVANLDGTSAFGTCTLSASFPNTDVAEVMAFGFSLPGGATVNGIAVSFTGSDSSSGTHAGTTYVQLLKAGTPTGTAKTLTMPSSSTTETLGSSSDLWGGSFAASDINGSMFGVGIQEQGASGNNTLSLKNVQITVTYTSSGISTDQMADCATSTIFTCQGAADLAIQSQIGVQAYLKALDWVRLTGKKLWLPPRRRLVLPAC